MTNMKNKCPNVLLSLVFITQSKDKMMRGSRRGCVRLRVSSRILLMLWAKYGFLKIILFWTCMVFHFPVLILELIKTLLFFLNRALINLFYLTWIWAFSVIDKSERLKMYQVYWKVKKYLLDLYLVSWILTTRWHIWGSVTFTPPNEIFFYLQKYPTSYLVLNITLVGYLWVLHGIHVIIDW